MGDCDKRRAIMKSSDKASSRKVIFSLHAPYATEVCVAGTFNGWDNHHDPLKKSTKGRWKLVKYLELGTHEYRFVVDGIWSDDPSCASRCSNPYGGENCILDV
jgi:1,4-alpha-glucan branching enzyme